jgi:hypothetical protein
MKNPIIHIGYPKTGTTWFHNSYYQKIKNINFQLPESFISDILQPSYSPPETDKDKRLVFHDPELTGVKRFIWDHGETRRNIASNLKKHFPNATIIIFLRNQIDFLTSGYIYYVRKGGTYLPDKIIDKIINNELNFSLDYLKYNETIEVYRNLFGAENVHVYLFEDFSRDTARFIADYTRRYDFDMGTDKINFTPVNDKLRMRLMVFMRMLNHFSSMDTPFKNNYLKINWIYRNLNLKYYKFNDWKIWGRKPSTSELFRPDQIAFIKDFYRETNRELQDKYQMADIIKYKYPM